MPRTDGGSGRRASSARRRSARTAPRPRSRHTATGRPARESPRIPANWRRVRRPPPAAAASNTHRPGCDARAAEERDGRRRIASRPPEMAAGCRGLAIRVRRTWLPAPGMPSRIGTSGTYDSWITCVNIAVDESSEARKVVRNNSFRATTSWTPRTIAAGSSGPVILIDTSIQCAADPGSSRSARHIVSCAWEAGSSWPRDAGRSGGASTVPVAVSSIRRARSASVWSSKSTSSGSSTPRC